MKKWITNPRGGANWKNPRNWTAMDKPIQNRKNCGRASCFFGTTTGKGNCKTESATYSIEYMGKNCKRRVGSTLGD